MYNRFNTRTGLSVLIFCTVFSGITAYAEDRHVPSQYATIESAIIASNSGDEIILAPGTYSGPGNNDFSIADMSLVFKSSGGPETCILDGFDAAANHWGFRLDNATFQFEGITFRNFGGVPSPNDVISAITGFDVIINITNCVFVDNISISGAVNIDGTFIVSNCRFENNFSTNEGGAALLHGSTVETGLVENCSFLWNHATNWGGAMKLGSGLASVIARDCIFKGNSSGRGAGVIVADIDDMTFERCVLENNQDSLGGAIYCVRSNSTFVDCILKGNLAGGNGGGIYCEINNNLEFQGCIIEGNFADFQGGGIYAEENCSITLKSTIVAGNYSENYGGGIYCSFGTTLFTDNATITENMSNFIGGGIVCWNATADITNSIIWGNLAILGPEIVFLANSMADIAYSNAEFYTDIGSISNLGPGNVYANPMFNTPGYWLGNLWFEGDYHLQSGSVSIDSGDPLFTPLPGETDIDGIPRVLGFGVDMGAYEYFDDCDTDGTPDELEPDTDEDGVIDDCDSCPNDPNNDSDSDGICGDVDICPGFDDNLDTDTDGLPDGCDACPNDSDNDIDNDGVCGDVDACPGFDDILDDDGDGVPDGCDVCPGSDDGVDADGDNTPDGCDVCLGFDDNLDTDSDTVPDGCDLCPGSDDTLDNDSDGVPDGCDICSGSDDTLDNDSDGVPDGCDICPGGNDNLDSDNDGVPDFCDVCPGFDDTIDSDTDGLPDGCDLCPNDPNNDSDNDGICGDVDVCPGFDDNVDTDSDGLADGCDTCPSDPNNDLDGDGVCGDLDICPGFDDAIDADGDGVPDGCDICAGFDDNIDIDNDNIPDNCDICQGDNVTGDSDSDGICDNFDTCPGFDDNMDTDNDGVANGCDTCPIDPDNDADADGVCGDVDICPGFDDGIDSDGDGTPDGCDICLGGDDNLDSDVDGVPDFCDVCVGSDDTLDSDGDTVPDGCDVCPGFDDSLDTDGDDIADGCDTCVGFDDKVDTDTDGVPDGCDLCPGFDDSLDVNNNGVPDGCEGPVHNLTQDTFHTTLQGAIDASFGGDEIVAQPGIYLEAINFLGKPITLRAINDDPNATIIDGNGVFHVVQCVSGEDPNTVLDGFTITGGDASGDFPDNRGGGLLNENSDPTIIDCTFHFNTGTHGAGMYNDNSNPEVTNCMFIENFVTSNGAGMYNKNSNPIVSTCTFSGNHGQNGGGIINDGSSPNIRDCIFDQNSVGNRGGGISNYYNSSPTITNCIFNGNTANDSGGGIENAVNDFDIIPTIISCIFSRNTAGNGGGGIVNSNSSLILINCNFRINSANIGGGIANFVGSSGGITGPPSISIITNCTFRDNSASSGGGVYNSGIITSHLVKNSIFWSNTPDEIVNSGSTALVSFSDIQGGLSAGTTDGGGNINADPLFIDPNGLDNIPGTEDDDLRLSAGSPCIDAGDNNALDPNTYTTDLAGRLRFVDDLLTPDTGSCISPVVDMGAYEYACKGNLNAYADVTLPDFALFTGKWMTEECDLCGGADFTGDNDVTTDDLLIQVANWLCGTTQVNNNATFQGLGTLPGGEFHSIGLGISPDGSVVVGRSNILSGVEAFRWQNGTMIGLGNLGGHLDNNDARDASADGSVVVGVSDSYLTEFLSVPEAFRWTAGSGMVGLGDLPGGNIYSLAEAVSADGSVIVGGSSSTLSAPSHFEAFRWEGGEMVGLGGLPGGSFFNSWATDVSSDGSVVVGSSYSASGAPQEAFRWEDGEMIGLGTFPGGTFASVGNGVSADGSVVVGRSHFVYDSTDGSVIETQAFRWEDGEMIGLGDLPGGNYYSEANATSADGSVIVGRSQSMDFPPYSEAFIWDANNGMRSLRDVLIQNYDLDLTNWTLWYAYGISDDGTTIAGTGFNPEGYTEAWIATLPQSEITSNHYVVGTLGKDRDGWSLTGPGHPVDGPPQLTEFITSTSNFGSSGIVTNKTFTIVELIDVSAQTLTDIDIFHLVFDGQGYQANVPVLSGPEIDALNNWVIGGGRLLVFVRQATASSSSLLSHFGIQQGVSNCTDETAFATAAMPSTIRCGPFGQVDQVSWTNNCHTLVLIDPGSPAQATLTTSGDVNEMVIGQFGNGKVLVFGDYYDSYTSIVTLQRPSIGFDVLMGNVMNYVAVGN